MKFNFYNMKLNFPRFNDFFPNKLPFGSIFMSSDGSFDKFLLMQAAN